jgi:outer membrane protein OmpA-like peptidoglycan-associated protein
MNQLVRRLSLAVLAAAILAPTNAPAQDRDAIIEQLSRGVKARKIDVEELRNSVKNKISVEAKPGAANTQIAIPELGKELPSISFEIYFDYDSAALSPQSMPTLIQLGQALKDERLSKFRFLIAGHTDAAGSREYNRALSERRADAVRTFLVTSFGIPFDQVAPIGFGLEKLKDPQNPLSGVNRRVEVINIGS